MAIVGQVKVNVNKPILWRLPILRNKIVSIDSSRLFETPRVVSKNMASGLHPLFAPWTDYVHSQPSML
ncbi:hypothetical protein EPI10_015388 [Gossypium australe]|uniref:Uncharacterized protein n=1 Tax=Gossypium australe TaxID=47621 RepID=A0A5B6VJY3_9ROSI|nr:hypothetical protein EPI10_015388 [Gossypium australe]